MRVKFGRSLLLFLVVFLSLCLFVACDSQDDTGDNFANKLLDIEFYSDDILIENQEISKLEDFKMPAVPEKPGYDFVCWKNQNGQIFDLSKLEFETTTLKLYAQYEIKKIKLTYVLENYEKLEPLIINYGEKASKLESPIKNGYTFSGWFIDNEFNTAFDTETIVKEDITLYGKWVKNSYNINLNFNNGKASEKLTLELGENIILPKDLIFDGHTFDGWYLDKNYKNKFDQTKMPSNNIDLFAKWTKNVYNINFDTNTCGDHEALNIEYGAQIQIPNNIVKDGYTLDGLYFDKEFNIKFNLSNMPSNSFTLYAKFVPNKYEITLHNLDKISTIEYYFGEGIYLALPMMPNRIFEGWYLDSAFSGDKVVEIIEGTKGNIDLYAKWLDGAKTISFISEGITIPKIVKIPGDIIEEPVVKREGYSLVGFYKDEDFVEKYTFDFMPNNDITLYVKWNINKYTLTFNTGGYGKVQDITLDYGTEINIPDVMSRIGYDFYGWCIDSVDGEKFTSKTMPGKNLTLYAKWTPKTCKILFETNGGSKIPNIIGFFGEKIIKPNDPEKLGYVFDGWYEDVYFTIPYEFKGLSAFKQIQMKLYAKWTRLSEIRYMDGLNNIIYVDYAKNGTTYTLLNPEVGTELYHPNDYFDGWYKDFEFVNPIDEKLVINEDVVILFGKWTNRSFIPMFKTFENVGNEKYDPILINSRREFIALLDYISTMRIGIDNKKYISLRYTPTFDVEVFDKEFKICLSQITGISYNFGRIVLSNRLVSIYVEAAKDVVTETPNPIKKSKIDNGLTLDVNAKRNSDFEDFKYNSYKDGITCRTSNQLFYVLQHGYKPLVVTGSPAEGMLIKAKEILRQIIDDTMLEYEKMYAIYCWCQANIYYDYKAVEIANNTTDISQGRYALHNEAWHLEGVFNRGIAVCDGIAKAVTVLARIEGITCIRVVSVDHAWNKVYLDVNNDGKKQWYGFDATWAYFDTEYGQSILMDHFLFSDDVKSEYRNQTAMNYLDVKASTNINPYLLDIFKYNGNKYDGMLDSVSDIKQLMSYAHNEMNNKDCRDFTLNVNVLNDITQEKLNEIISGIVNINNQLIKNDIDIDYKIFIADNRYLLNGYVAVIYVNRKIVSNGN